MTNKQPIEKTHSTDNVIIGFLACSLSNRTLKTPTEWIKFAKEAVESEDMITVSNYCIIAKNAKGE